MSTRESILAILKDVPSPRIRQIGEGWQIGFAWVGGARKDGDSLARDLRAKWYTEAPPKGYEGPRPAPEPQPATPATDGEIERLRKLVDELQAKAAQPERVEIPAFLKEPEPVPSDLTDLVDVADTPAETNTKLLAKWNEANGLIQLAHDRGERPSMDLIRKRDRLESGIRWNRGRLAEQI